MWFWKKNDRFLVCLRVLLYLLGQWLVLFPLVAHENWPALIEAKVFSYSETQEGLHFIFDKCLDKPTFFETKKPNRIVFDYRGAINQLPKDKQHLLNMTPNIVEVSVFEGEQKIRLVITLKEGIKKEIKYKNDGVLILFPKEMGQSATKVKDPLEEKLSLNFQDIEIRAVLQILADFTGLNIIASDAVRGKVTLRLENVPAKEALETILKTNNLVQKQQGKVLMVAKREEVVQQEKQERLAQEGLNEAQQLEEALIPIHYAKASELALILKKENSGLLSQRGNVIVDERTNSLFVVEISSKLKTLQKLIKQLDVPVKQVLIESRIVFAKEDFEQALGLKIHSTSPQNKLPASQTLENRLNVHLPSHLQNAHLGMASLGFAVARLPKETVLDLELMALESEGLGKIIARPRLVTSNQERAYIETGEEIPYQESTSSGAASVAFRKAVLRLEVTPHITSSNQIILDLKVNQDSRGALTNGVPAINTREMQTKVLVEDGETIVLGGIYQQQKGHIQRRVPYISQIPLLGTLFKNKALTEERNELMIFVTPQILKQETG